MQMLERNKQLGRVEPTPLLVELALPLEVMEQLSSVDKREDEVELLLGLKRELEGNDEGVVDLGEDGSLGEGVDDLGTGDDVRLSDRLQRVDSGGVALSDLHDLQKEQSRSEGWRRVEGRNATNLSEAALSDDLEELERVDGEGDVLRETITTEDQYIGLSLVQKSKRART